MGYSKDLIYKALDELGYDKSIRSEALDVSDFVRLSDWLGDNK